MQAAAASGDWRRRRVGADRGLRHLRARSGAAAARARPVALPECRVAVLVRQRRARRARAADQAQGAAGGARRRRAPRSTRRSAEAEQRIGSGPGSRVSIVANSAIIVFREGLEAVLILAALMASMVGPQRRYRRPLLGGVVLALAASVVTWVVAQTVLGSLARYGEKLEAVGLARRDRGSPPDPQLVLPPRLLAGEPAGPPPAEEVDPRRRGLSLAAAQIVGLVALGFTSVYREGFETTLFLQALTLEAGAWTVLQGVADRLRRRRRRLLPRRRARAQAAAQEDADRHGRDDHLGAGRARRPDGAGDAEGRLGPGDPDRGSRAAVLGGRVARPLPDLGGPDRPGRRRRRS